MKIIKDSSACKVQEQLLEIATINQETVAELDLTNLITESENFCTATEIAKMIGKGWTSTKVNEKLVEMELQCKEKSNNYFPTEKAVELGVSHRVTMIEYKDGKTWFSYSLVWNYKIIQEIRNYIKEASNK